MPWPSSTSEQPGCRVVYLPERPPADAPGLFADEPDLLTVRDIARLTSLSEQTIRAEINSGHLPGCRIGRRLFVPKPQFIEYVGGGA